jgi:copper chaperone CopZ
MNTKSTLLFLITILITTSSFTSPNRDEFTIEFITLGNCYTCKLRIEAALNKTEGVTASNWDWNNDVTTVTYDDLMTDAFLVMQAVADTGHDTEWFRAPEEAYTLLIGTCCEYDRTIDYTLTQVGYLSLMDLWMPHVDIEEIKNKDIVSVYPTIGNGVFSLNFHNSGVNKNIDIRIYSITGNLIWADKDAVYGDQKIDISSAPVGQYIVCTLSDGVIISRTKISKQ